MAINVIDLLIKNINIYNSYFKKFSNADVWILDEKIYYIDEKKTGNAKAKEVLDGTGLSMVPGLIDIHMHIESSMMTPKAFSDYLVSCGVTTVVAEPHEMANVNGIDGILDMIRAGENSLIDILYGIPSCVPSTDTRFETTGGCIRCEEMEKLKEHPSVVCVGEVMCYRQIIRDNDLEIKRFLEKVRRTDSFFPIEGHCPSLLDLDLAKFLFLGINGDHTEHTLEELRQRFAGGMFVEIQEKMLRKEVLDFIAENDLFEHFSFVTDDAMADVLCEYGHLDELVRKAVALGMAPEQAIYNASFTAARRMNLYDRGSLAPGKLADFVLLDNLETFSIAATYKNGRVVYQKESPSPVEDQNTRFGEAYYHSIKLPLQTEDCLQIVTDAPDGIVQVRAIEIKDGGTKTKEKIVEMEVMDGQLHWQESGCLLTAVFERYGKNGNIGYGFLCGDCHKRGAVASSFAHDSHNILVAGANTKDMLAALNHVITLQGGMVVTDQGVRKAELQLNIGGILSAWPARKIGQGLKQVREALINLGYCHYNPIMSLGTITLPASPKLKLTDKGLIDVEHSCIVPLILPRQVPSGNENNLR